MWLTAADISKSLYLKLVKKYHPDLGLSLQDIERRTEMMKAITIAWKENDIFTLQQIDLTGKVPPPRRTQMPPSGFARARPNRTQYTQKQEEIRKENRLREWRLYLNHMWHGLSEFGGYEGEIRVDRNGLGSGIVYGSFFNSTKPYGLYVQMFIAIGGQREETLLARWVKRLNPGQGRLHQPVGPDHLFRVDEIYDMSYGDMAKKLVDIVDRKNKEG